jgi:NAD(P)-dependent dehydrogenase (short-subunit alcohol dehydrogenase family)
MTTIGIIGAGEIGSQVARAAIANGYSVVIANSRGPETLKHLIDELGPSARAVTAAGAAEAGGVCRRGGAGQSGPTTCPWKRSLARSCWIRTTT